MTVLRRGTQLFGIGALVAVGAALIAGATVTGTTVRSVRVDTAAVFRDVARPDVADWGLALLGAAAAVLGLAMLISQFLPPRRGSHRMYEVHRDTDGSTRIRGRAVINNVRRTLEQLDGITAADARWNGKVIRVEIRVDDEANLQSVETRARDALGHPFWIDLGLADAEMDLVVLHGGRSSGKNERKVT